MRGEDASLRAAWSPKRGSPPHARGRRIELDVAGVHRLDHPRMRGEDVFAPFFPPFERGSPPHARGRPTTDMRVLQRAGITPACAGKTVPEKRPQVHLPDHPRMRGEDTRCASCPFSSLGSPPHARGRRRSCQRGFGRCGITPACAGKTNYDEHILRKDTDHPRMRGEDTLPTLFSTTSSGSPPHARGRLNEIASSVREVRITPACAGKTQRFRFVAGASVDHPRMRGEDSRIPFPV